MARHIFQICVYLLINSISSEEIEGQDDMNEDFTNKDNGILHEDLHHSENIDIRLTENQTKIFQEILGKNFASSTVKSMRAIAGGAQVRLWDENYDAAEDRFLLAYYFDSNPSHTEKQKDLIRKSFGQFGDYTCVKMVEVSRSDNRFKH